MSDETVIVDYGLCNLDSIARAVQECGGLPVVSETPASLTDAARIILPGVGSFAAGMKNLRDRGLDSAVCDELQERPVPLLGICLGMQMLATGSEEGGKVGGLGLVPGEVMRLQPVEDSERVPHIGWNEVTATNGHELFDGVVSGADFYFVHSFHFVPKSDDHVAAKTPYCGGFSSAVARDNIMGVQFHPEKSQAVGFALLRNFLRMM